MIRYLEKAVSIEKTLLSACVSTVKYQRYTRDLLKTGQIVRLGEKDLLFLVVKRHNCEHVQKCELEFMSLLQRVVPGLIRCTDYSASV